METQEVIEKILGGLILKEENIEKEERVKVLLGDLKKARSTLCFCLNLNT
jgi:hypothetical protein